MKPLDRVPSIKLKLGLLIVAAVAVSATMSQVGFKLGWPVWLRPVVSACVGLLMVQLLARGTTSPLRQMARAARAMARGDYDQRITTDSRDEIGELADAFNSMARDLGVLEHERRALVANAAHELRTPIAGLSATIDNLRDGVIEPTDEVLDRLAGQVERLGHTVNALLDLSRLEAPDAPHRREVVDVGDVAHTAVVSATADAPDRDVLVTVREPAVVEGDPDLIERLFVNLVRNAVVHGGGDILVNVTRSPTSACVEFVDEGPGIASDDVNQIFERFYRGASPRGHDRPGTGLGLAICRAIVDQHGGTISAGNGDHGG